MVRTKADAYTKASVKAPRKTSVLTGGSSSGSSTPKSGNKYSGMNGYCPRPVPEWQKPITSFFGSPNGAPKEDDEHKPDRTELIEESAATATCSTASASCSTANDDPVPSCSEENSESLIADDGDQ